MSKTEELKKEVKELLSTQRQSIYKDKKIFFDKTTNQFTIKIPKEISLAAQLKKKSQVRMIVNPNKEELEEIQKSHFIIYEK